MKPKKVLTEDDIELFWKSVTKDAPRTNRPPFSTTCWIWNGPVDQQSLGQFVSLAGDEFRTEEMAFLFDRNLYINLKKYPKKACSRRRCVNPRHILTSCYNVIDSASSSYSLLISNQKTTSAMPVHGGGEFWSGSSGGVDPEGGPPPESHDLPPDRHRTHIDAHQIIEEDKTTIKEADEEETNGCSLEDEREQEWPKEREQSANLLGSDDTQTDQVKTYINGADIPSYLRREFETADEVSNKNTFSTETTLSERVRYSNLLSNHDIRVVGLFRRLDNCLGEIADIRSQLHTLIESPYQVGVVSTPNHETVTSSSVGVAEEPTKRVEPEHVLASRSLFAVCIPGVQKVMLEDEQESAALDTLYQCCKGLVHPPVSAKILALLSDWFTEYSKDASLENRDKRPRELLSRLPDYLPSMTSRELTRLEIETLISI